MPKHAAVKRRLVSKADVEKYATGQLAKEEFTKRFAQEELSMKKLGFLPRDFNLKEFLVKSTGQENRGLLRRRNEDDLHAELGSSRQPGAYSRARIDPCTAGPELRPGEVDESRDEGLRVSDALTIAPWRARPWWKVRRWWCMWIICSSPWGAAWRTPRTSIYQMEDPAVKGAIDSQLMHDAPMILREAGTFAYQRRFDLRRRIAAQRREEDGFCGGVRASAAEHARSVAARDLHPG